MRKKLFGAALAVLSMTLMAPLAAAQPVTPEAPAATAEPTTPAPETDPTTEPTTPSPAPTPTPTPTPTPAPLTPEQAIYMQPGYHLVNGRYWFTECAMYSSNIVRCTTNIFGTKVFTQNGNWYTQNTWVFNNLTYLPSNRDAWKGNPLAADGVVGGTASWATDGREWRTECDTARTGRGACRNFVKATVASVATGKVTQSNIEVLNSMVRFSSSTLAPVTAVLPKSTTPAGVPTPGKPVQIITAPRTQSGFRMDERCMTGRTFCISMAQNKMAWVVDGKIQKVVDVRFGKTSTPTRKGAFKIYYKSRDHFSSIYKVDMPFALFFDGGIAIHYSANFRRVGYSGGSGGCVNVRDYAQMQRFFDTARVGDKVIVY